MNTIANKIDQTSQFLEQLTYETCYNIARTLVDRLDKLGVFENRPVLLKDPVSMQCAGPLISRNYYPIFQNLSGDQVILTARPSEQHSSFCVFSDEILREYGLCPKEYNEQLANTWFINEIEARYGKLEHFKADVNQAVWYQNKFVNLV